MSPVFLKSLGLFQENPEGWQHFMPPPAEPPGGASNRLLLVSRNNYLTQIPLCSRRSLVHSAFAVQSPYAQLCEIQKISILINCLTATSEGCSLVKKNFCIIVYVVYCINSAIDWLSSLGGVKSSSSRCSRNPPRPGQLNPLAAFRPRRQGLFLMSYS